MDVQNFFLNILILLAHFNIYHRSTNIDTLNIDLLENLYAGLDNDKKQ